MSRIDDAVIHAPSHRVHTLSSFDVTFRLHDRRQEIRFTLTPNIDVLAEDAVIHYINPDGTVHTEPIDQLGHRVYRGDAFVRGEGHSEWSNAGWARIVVLQDGPSPVLEGAFRLNGDHHHILTSKNYVRTRVDGDPSVGDLPDDAMVVWRDSDIGGIISDELKRDLAEEASCSSDTLEFNQDMEHPVYRGLDARAEPSDTTLWSLSTRALFGRQIDGTTGGNGAGVNLAASIGSTEGCPTTRKVALLGMATDCTYTGLFDTQADLRTHIIQQVNSASQLYESSFNISLGIQNLTISNESCPTTPAAQTPWNMPCSDSLTINDRLSEFSKWRGQFTDTNAFWTLLTTCGTGSAVGLAWLGQVCVQGSTSPENGNETIAAVNVVVHTSTEWQILAHETGHTFGAVHDCTSSTCGDGTVTKQQCCPLSKDSCNADGKFIMNPATGSDITKFSPCSIGNICSAIGRSSVKIGCLTNNRDVSTITGSQCGNGIVESGEDCDCGGESGCEGNPCCDPKTCKFTDKSVCDPANEECCTKECQFAGTGTVCRPSTGECDPREVCTGKSALCPADVTAPDGDGCGASGSNLKCSSGQCTSRDLQCRTLMGSLTTSNDTYACSSQGCQLSCASPEFGSNTCLTMQQNFLDGTACQGGGKCSNGACKGSTVGNEIAEWFRDNKTVAIPVGSVVGGLAAIAIVSCCATSIRARMRKNRRRKERENRKKNKIPGGPTGPPPPAWTAYAGVFGGGPEQHSAPRDLPPVPAPAPAVPPRRSGNRVHRRNGATDGMPPPILPLGPNDQPPQPVRFSTARYA